MMRILGTMSLLGTVVACSLVAAQGAANSMSVSESFSEKLVQYHDSDTGETWWDVADTISGTIQASVPLGETDITLFDESTAFEIGVGGNPVCSVVLGDDASYSAGKRTATFTSADPPLQVKATWTTTTLTISGTVKSYDFLGLDSSFEEQIGKITQESEMTITLGSFSITRPMLLSGTRSVTTTTKNGEEFDLETVKLGGSADFTAPTVTITSPAANYRTTNDSDVVFTGKTADNVGVAAVYYCVSTSPTLSGEEELLDAELSEDGKQWTAPVTPSPGTNYVFVMAQDYSGNESAFVKRSFRYSKMSQVVVTLEGSGKVSGVTNGQWLEIGTRYTAVAKPNSGQVLAYWQCIAEETLIGHGTSYTFSMAEGLELVATFVANPFSSVKGTHVGLFYDHENGLDPTNSGAFTMTVTTNGAYSGKLTMMGGTYSFSGQLALYPSETDENVAYADLGLYIGHHYLEGSLSLDLTGAEGLTGWYEVYDPNSPCIGGDWIASGQFDSALARTSTAKSEQGVHNLYLQGQSGDGGPVGRSYGTATVDAKAGVKLTLNLADPDQSAALSGSLVLTTSGMAPFCFPAYGGKGLIMGWLQIAEGQLWGEQLIWVKPAGKTYYSQGFTVNPTATGLLYIAPKAGTNLVDWTSGTIDLADGADIAISKEVSFAKNKFTVVGDNPNKISLSVAPTTGALSGSFVPTGSSKSVTFKGVLLRSTAFPGAAYGFFKSPVGSGSVLLNGQ